MRLGALSRGVETVCRGSFAGCRPMTPGAIVLHHRYGIGTGDEHTWADVARELGMSRQRICRIEAQALAHVREPAQAHQAPPHSRALSGTA